MKQALLVFAALAILVSCNAPAEKETTKDVTITVSVDDFFANPDEYVDQELTVSGLVTHVCKHGGQKLFIVGTDDSKALRIDVGEDIPEFEIGMEGSEASFTGKLELMDAEFMAGAQAEHEEHHAEEEDTEHKDLHQVKEKNYHLVASTFKTK